MKTMICSQCGAGLELTEDKEFFVCPACGIKVYNMANESLQITKEKIEEAVEEAILERRRASTEERIRKQAREERNSRLYNCKTLMITSVVFMILPTIIAVPALIVFYPFRLIETVILIVYGFLFAFALFWWLLGFVGYKKAKNEKY